MINTNYSTVSLHDIIVFYGIKPLAHTLLVFDFAFVLAASTRGEVYERSDHIFPSIGGVGLG